MDGLKLVAAIIILVLGVCVGWVGGTLYADIFTVPAAELAAKNEERLTQDAKRREAEARARADQQAQQAEIDMITADYTRRTAEQSAQLAKLEQALSEKPDDPPATGGTSCRVLIPGRVSDQLNRTGRAFAPSHSGQPDAAMPRPR
ncbi:hypothetical protein NS226_06645 [Aureimonas ureilytica]|uniref:Uncharacterized protein n=2 Tax=Aureimonas ureilytica TaxID=401562 RepID=A0A175RA20_9HYPH|nr:hypothetical protein NS226_06645 [Aureimonas ureilytica]